MSKYTYTDTMGNTFTIFVKADGAVTACNQNRYPVSLANFCTSGTSGYKQQAIEVKAAARKGLAELRRVTRLDWNKA